MSQDLFSTFSTKGRACVSSFKIEMPILGYKGTNSTQIRDGNEYGIESKSPEHDESGTVIFVAILVPVESSTMQIARNV